MNNPLLKRLADLREAQNTSPKSSDLSATPLRVYLSLYNKAQRECYLEYMEGAKALYNWLAPIDIPEVPYTRIPSMLISYELVELSKILSEYSKNKDLVRLRATEQVIAHTLMELTL